MARRLVLTLLALVGCAAPRAGPGPGRLILYEKGSLQILQDAEGRVLRVHHDGNGDRKVDSVTILDEAGRVLRTEVDRDLDGRIDEWSESVSGTDLTKRARSRKGTGRPDAWSYLEPSETILQAFDDDGDGRVDRVEGGRGEPREARDTDQDGRPDRWTVRLGERVVAEDLDTDGDGRPDRRLVRGSGGEVLLVEADPDGDGVWVPAGGR